MPSMNIFTKKKATVKKKNLSKSTTSKKDNLSGFPFGGTVMGCTMSMSGNHDFIYDSKAGREKCSYCGMVNDN